MTLTVEFDTDDEARKAYLALEGDIAAQHNFIAMATEYAERLVRELRMMEQAATCLRKAFYKKHGFLYNIRTGEQTPQE